MKPTLSTFLYLIILFTFIFILFLPLVIEYYYLLLFLIFISYSHFSDFFYLFVFLFLYFYFYSFNFMICRNVSIVLFFCQLVYLFAIFDVLVYKTSFLFYHFSLSPFIDFFSDLMINFLSKWQFNNTFSVYKLIFIVSSIEHFFFHLFLFLFRSNNTFSKRQRFCIL